jgi:hypothetical protein
MRKHQLFSITLFFLSFISFGQSYLPLIEENKQWNEYGYLYPDANWTDFYYIGGDTVINDLDYVKLLWDSNVPNTSLYLIGFLRENDEGQVYYIELDKADPLNRSEEYLLYDFDSQPGDTLEVYSAEWSGSCMIMIDSVVPEEHFNITRDKYYYHLLEGSWETTFWIEGLGSSYGLLNACMNIIDAGSYLLCVSKDTSLLYFSPDWGTCEVPCTVSVEEITPAEIFTIFPNPNNGTFVVKSNKDDFVEFQLYNLYGELITHFNVSTNANIDLSHYYNASGMLIYTIRKDHQTIKTGKMILN